MRSPFPKVGQPHAFVMDELAKTKARDIDWRSGKTNFYVQFGGDDVLDVARRAADLFFSENAHGLGAFPSVQQLQTDVVDWVLDLVQAGPLADGCLTASGSESILFCLKAARDWAKARRPDLTTPKIIVARSAHPAFEKAGGLLGLEVVRTPLAADYRADVEAMRAQLCHRTIMVAGSAPQFGHGVVDPIPEIAALGIEHNLWVHVDACVGALFAPFARAAGAVIPPFDFSIDGVRSISADIHKYGFGAKGASTALFRHSCWRPSYVFAFDDWPIGSYGSSGLAGTRSAAPIAAAWAVMRYLGHDGYVRIARQILDAFQRLKTGLQETDGIELVGDPDFPVLAWRSPDVPVDALVASMTKRGWFVRTMTQPSAIHLGMITLHQAPVVDAYLESVRGSVADYRAR